MADVLRTELTTDPLARGYSGMTDEQAAASLNTVNRTVPRTSATGSDIIKATVLADYAALSAANQNVYWGMVGAGGVDPQDANTVAIFTALFSGKTTLTNLAALRTTPVSRAAELGLGVVTAGEIGRARA